MTATERVVYADDRQSKACRGKIGYASGELAGAEAKRLHRERPEEFFSVYRCSLCTLFHVGHAFGQRGRCAANVGFAPEAPGEYEELVKRHHHLQACIGEINDARPDGWAAKRRRLVGDLSVVNQRMQEIKALRRRVAR